ncbi:MULTISPECIES: D-alanyl-D-alanine carboxypeptidase [unclassified Streptomyces]|uniref:D-alanyl-D-alanine carboxypeptidase n=1 Tax=unclassified Streptomyces TaxID=2593676 RepID=UPI0006BF75E8|nr:MULTISPECIES: D-alanyl-D-alanine carboxypeptidase [unclassified Streptomyces]KOV71630.1 D-alanyl-D-alanine carboxypeptidase [Streptomyces sp. NRRL WC-3723]
MEEASVAGESPDRSKQRESSAEPTSGSAGSVPEARDPRLAVSRERKSSAGDTATKVLTVRPGTPTTRKQSADPEDTDLQAAVSTWVREPSPDTPANADDAGEEPAKAAKPKTGAEAEAEAEEPSDAEAGAEGTSDAKAEAEEPSDADAEAEDTSDAKAEAQEPSDADTEAKGTSDAKADAEEPSDAKAETQEPSDADAEAEDTSDAKADVEEPSDADADRAEPAEDEDAKADAGAEAGTDAEAGAESVADAEADADAKDPADAETGEGAEGGAGVAVGGEGVAEAVAGEDGPEDADGRDAPEGSPAAGAASRTGDAGGKPDAEGEDEAAHLDQPTTVFKAVRPKTPPVDQPTTMLKLGGKPKAPESESERTSKFVALKDDLRKPAAEAKAADATTPVPQIGPERTTQQPLPPKPPLDLLAELTNTPPPPETPVRTLVRRIKIWTPLVLLLAIIFAVVQAVRPLPTPTLALTGKDSYTFAGDRTQLPWPGEGQGWMDVDGVGTMGHFGKQTPVAIGSVAKTMTAYIILKDHPLKPGQEGPKIKVDATAEKEGGYNKAGESTLDTVKAGDTLTEKQALSAVLIPSANNIARLLARWDAGSEAAFVKKMNATAKELGMTGTTYTDPSGLKETTVSTAEDQVKLGRAFVKVPALVAISSAASWTDPSGKFWPNYNELPYRIGAIGIKTGSTTAAGGNLLFASRKQVGGQTVTIVGAILGQHKPEILKTVNAVSKTALLAAQDALTSAKIVKKGDVVGYVDDRLGGRTPVVVTKDVTAAGWAGKKVELSFASGTVPHTAKAGTRVGTLTVGDGTAGAVKVPVALQKDLTEPGIGAKLTRLG